MKQRIGIMGAGDIAVRFVQAAAMVDGVEVTAVSSKSLARAQAFAQANGVPAAFGSYEAMLSSGLVDWVYIATTGNFHYENILLALSHGKHVLCEKNMVAEPEEAEHVFSLAKEKGLFVMEGMWSCFVPCVQKAREWIAQGRIGKPALATYTGGIHAPADHRIFSKELGGGAMYDLGVYPLEIVSYVLGRRPLDAICRVDWGDSGVDETVSLIVNYEGVQGCLACTCHSRIPSPSGFYGPGGFIRMEKTHMTDSVKLFDEQFNLVDEYTYAFENGFQFEIAHVRDCIEAGMTESPEATWQMTLDSTQVYRKVLGR